MSRSGNEKMIPPSDNKGTMISGTGAGRDYARGTIEMKIKKLQQEIDALKLLIHYIPWDSITDEHESMLWSFFVRYNING